MVVILRCALGLAAVAASAWYLVSRLRDSLRAAREEIAECRRVAERLRESEARLRLAVDAAHMGIWDWNLVTGEVRVEVDWRDASEPRDLTQPAFDVAFEAGFELVHPDDRPLVTEAISRAVQEGRDYDTEMRVFWPDGTLRWIAAKGRVLRDEGSRPVRLIGVPMDITERKRAEQRLAVQYATTRVLAECATLEEAAPHVLRAICECLGWVYGALWRVDGEAALLGCVDTWHAPSLDVSAFDAASRGRTFAPGIGLPGRVWRTRAAVWIPDVAEDANFPRAPIARRDGLHAAFGFPIRSGSEVLGVLEFFSPRILSPDEPLLAMMETMGTQIGQFIERRHVETERARLLDRVQAEARRKDEFLAMLGHELRNPLAAIHGATQVLDRIGWESPQAPRQRAIIERQTGQLARLVDDLLDVARVVSGKIVLQHAPVDLNDVAARGVQSLEPRLQERWQEVTFVPAVERAVVRGDAFRLEQVFFNLLDNAIKYTPPGGRIHISVERVGRDGVMRVRDTGIGMSPQLVPHVFDMFAQAERALDRAAGGLGLGLTLVRRLVEQHGGTVLAESAGLDRGSEFVVTLPLMEDARVTDGPRAGGPQHPEAPRRHILLIEDNDDGREALRTLLELLGHRVDVAGDGAGGIAIARRSPPDVAVIDIGLPGVDGYQVARALRLSGGRIRMVALTGYGTPEDRRRAIDAGFDAHLVKPVDPEELARVLAELAADAA